MTVEERFFSPPASAAGLEALRQALPVEVPADYFEFLARSDGGEIFFEGEGVEEFDCLCIHSVSEMLELREAHAENFPSLLVLGGDQGGQHLGYDTSGQAPWPIVMFLPGWGITRLADTFSELEQRYFVPPGEDVRL